MSKKIVFSVLNWGLGHATRSAAIIHELCEHGHEIILASDGIAKEYLMQEFPSLKTYTLPSLNIKYPFRSLFWNMSYQWPAFLRTMILEHRAINKIIEEEEQVDFIISDNRYGCFSKNIRSIFITHQLNLPISNFILKFFINRIIRHLIHNFDECWIPDYADRRLTQKLSDTELSIPRFFIGPLSHFARCNPVHHLIKRELIVILSGPEPQRTQFEHRIMEQLSTSIITALIVRGAPKNRTESTISHKALDICSFLRPKELLSEIQSSRYILCRSGYSSIMDLEYISKPALLIPTPGQSEQEYLALIANKSGRHYCVSQNRLDLASQLDRIPTLSNPSINSSGQNLSELLKQRIINSHATY